MMIQTKHLITTALLSATVLGAGAAPIPFYTDSGFGQMSQPNANSWSLTNKTNSSVIFETFIDYTQLVADATDPIAIFEVGADGTGAGVALDGSEILFAAGSAANTGEARGAHGLSAGDLGVQIVAAYEIGAGTGTNELLSLYVNGKLIATDDAVTNNDWAGANASHLGVGDAFAVYENSSISAGNNVEATIDYPDQNTTITFAAYELGVGDNTLENILVPSPSAALAGLVGMGALIARRRRG